MGITKKQVIPIIHEGPQTTTGVILTKKSLFFGNIYFEATMGYLR
jgi:hypothetical protein